MLSGKTTRFEKEPVNYLVGAKDMGTFRFSVVLEKDKEGYFVFCSELQGCYTQGETYEEAMENIRDAIRLHVEDRIQSGSPITRVRFFTPKF